ncbi:MAG: delta-class carbonic anhydrase [Pseudomonadota bacterium]
MAKISKCLLAAVFLLPGTAQAAGLCQGFGPQTPRDISLKAGGNQQVYAPAPASTAMNLCNIHFHTNAEHKGPGFSVFAGNGKHGGYKCNGSKDLSTAELAMPAGTACAGLKPGDTIEVHWVHSSCKVNPGKGLGSCLSKSCANPQLRVEAQTFLVVNDPNAADFDDFVYAGNVVNGLHQPKALPTGTGKPVVFAGSTTGPSYTQAKCSPFQVTWSVRPSCTKIHIGSLSKWCEGNVFKEDHAHGVRQLVTAPELLATID